MGKAMFIIKKKIDKKSENSSPLQSYEGIYIFISADRVDSKYNSIKNLRNPLKNRNLLSF